MPTTTFGIFLILLVSAFGAAVGSFLNVVILRTHSHKALSGRSACPHCGHILGIADLIPILSFIMLNGRCRYCRKIISWQYPAVEVLTALAFTLVFLKFGTVLLYSENIIFGFLKLSLILFLVSVLIVVAVSDIKWGIIPDKIIYPSIIFVTIYRLIEAFTAFFINNPLVLREVALSVLMAFGVGGFFLALIMLTLGRGIGGGDLKLVIFIGLSLAWYQTLVGVFLAFLTGAIVSVMLLLLGKKSFKQTIAFGPYLSFGAFISLLYGDRLLRAYLNTLGL